MPDADFAHLIGTLILALLTGTWQPAPSHLTVVGPQPVQFSAWWHPLDRPGNERDLVVVGVNGNVLAGGTSSAVSPPRH